MNTGTDSARVPIPTRSCHSVTCEFTTALVSVFIFKFTAHTEAVFVCTSCVERTYNVGHASGRHASSIQCCYCL